MPTTATKLTSAQLRVVATLGFCGLVSAADNWFVSPALPSIAAGLSAGLGGILTDLVGWRAAFASFGALALVAWLLLFGLREPVRDEGDEAPAPTAADGSPVASFLGEAGRVLAGPGRPVFALACTTGVAFLGVYGLMGTFLAEACGLTATQAGLVMMLYGVLCLVGGASSGRLGARGGLSRVVSVGEASGVVAALALLAGR